MVEFKCDLCNKEASRSPANLNRYPHAFCGKDCFAVWRSFHSFIRQTLNVKYNFYMEKVIT